MAQYRKERMTNIMAGPAQGGGQGRWEKGEKCANRGELMFGDN